MIVYADNAALEAWLGNSTTLPDNVSTLLRSASLLVSEAMACDLYDVDGSGLPTDATRKQAAQDATCAQVETWMNLGIDPTAGAAGVARQVASSSLLDGKVSYSEPSRAADDRVSAARDLGDQAIAILRQAGIPTSQPWSL